MRPEIHLFGGQGSQGLYAGAALMVARKDAETCPSAQELLFQCHASLVHDCVSFSRDDPTILEYIKALPSAASLLSPPSDVQRLPAIQGAMLCLYQLLRVLGCLPEGSPSSYQEAIGRIRETIGFCSGILPAVVLAASPTLEAFVKNGVNAFRAAFCIGYHAGSYSSGLCDDARPWAVAIAGLNYAGVLEELSDFNRSSQVPLSAASSLRPSYVTLSGPGPQLDEFVARLPNTCHVRPVYVYAYYHGGEQMRHVAARVLQDLQRLEITMPRESDLVLDLRDSSDGSVVSSTSGTSPTLAIRIVEAILVRPADWPLALGRMAADLEKDAMSHDAPTAVRAVSYGPFTNLMLADFRITSPAMTLGKADVAHESPETQLAANFEPSERDIAIVGMGLDFLSGSDQNDFFQSLFDMKSFAKEAPEDRLLTPRAQRSSKPTPVHGNFLANPWAFDHKLFGVPPRETEFMDPQQRVILQCAYHALEHAGYVPDTTSCSRQETFACYVAMATVDYANRLRDDTDVYYSTGNLRAFASGRLSYYFGFGGPSVVLDTACSGSLVAIHSACQALITRDCNAALAGGVNVIYGPEMQQGLARSHFLSPSQQCRPFEAAADGYCRGEGCGMFVLKRLSDAISGNDRILGVIKGSAINQSGTAHSITHPHSMTQQILIERALERAAILPESIGVVEAHGTGTKAGDPVEFEAISDALAAGRTRAASLFISSIKGSIGHAEAASAGLDTINPEIARLLNDHTVIPREATQWPRPYARYPRRALLNNFGAAGSNACLILEDFIPKSDQSRALSGGSHIVAISAKNKDAFNRAKGALLRSLHHRKLEQGIQDISYTSLRRTLLETRLIVTVKSTQQLIRVLEDPKTLPQQHPFGHERPRVVFVFSGQGSQH
ncbi:Uu.00g045000.m01.CDS01 [Anthostomella pinea]|uniref:Uu.00g045000.m01.CDS01 n=1 Tax=Anthostomella pinea TaxID=933095 RepID=A0AAI8YED6_9PEZI|nr:Uu.00g045000.m01.CDS01 [Anthostomella pinea]